tara:strand:+ start:1739 stop:1945 length:207 start_codon:yes stop_codon:yes gene_type:complete
MKSKEVAIALMGASILFGLWGLFTLLGQPEKLLGGDAYNYITAAGRGTGLVCMGIIFAVLGNALNPKE